jgi:hypothetical protein
MKKKTAIVVGLLFVLLLVAAYLWFPAAVPPGQKPLTVLSNANLREFAAAFDSHDDVPRIVVLLSPT